MTNDIDTDDSSTYARDVTGRQGGLRAPGLVRRAAAAVALAAVLAGAVAPAASAASPDRHPAVAHAGRGTLLAVTPVGSFDRQQVVAYETEAGIEGAPLRYGVRAYRLTYATVTPHGRPTTATGLLVLPVGGPRRLDLVSDTHGTVTHRDSAPSGGIGDNRLTAYLHASAGRAVAAPDYLGLGGGPGRHPYMDTRSSVTASHDMLRAARAAAARLGRPVSRDVYVTGFSQGGQVAMALGRELARPGSGFRLRALAPIAGPYDIAGEQVPALFDGRVDPHSGVFYLSYFLTAQNRLHPLYKSPSDVFKAPYASFVEDLFDGRHQEEAVLAALPADAGRLLTPAWAAKLRHPHGVLKAVLTSNSRACDWKPTVPVRLYAATGDRDVPIGNSRSCARDLAAHGARGVRVVDQGADATHFVSAFRSAPRTARWFDSLAD
ncbi:alpha/beta hydrolase [Streptomyces sp. NPDC093225]|uniref:alpha/beta hydrolase n=1 Tax=Streptomyces sp. NPDC093225 TaxID=3366034 RepID=UPI00381C1418